MSEKIHPKESVSNPVMNSNEFADGKVYSEFNDALNKDFLNKNSDKKVPTSIINGEDLLKMAQLQVALRNAEMRASLAESRLDAVRLELENERARIDVANQTIRRANARIRELEAQASSSRQDFSDPQGFLGVLGLSHASFSGRTDEEIVAKIKANFRVEAQRVHPDHGGSTDKMSLLNQAVKVLSDPITRRQYLTQTDRTSSRPRR